LTGARVPRSAVEVGEVTFLRPLTSRDTEAFVEAVRHSRRLHRPWVTPPADAEAFAAYLRRSRRPTDSVLAACRLSDGGLAGVFHLGQIVRGHLESAYLGYYAFEPLAGQGHMLEGMRLLLRHAFERLRLHRVEANVQPGNARSRRLAEACGFRLEGYSPRYLRIDGVWQDHERWAITVEDWRDEAGP
jgi:ribosomal-protein-alanine N-acetyltransferase